MRAPSDIAYIKTLLRLVSILFRSIFLLFAARGNIISRTCEGKFTEAAQPPPAKRGREVTLVATLLQLVSILLFKGAVPS